MSISEDIPQCCGRDMHRGGYTAAGAQRWCCSGCGRRTTNRDDSSKEHAGFDTVAAAAYAEQIRAAVKAGQQTFVVTCAANNSPLAHSAWNALQQVVRHRQAMLMVVPVHYKNVSLYTGSQAYNKYWTRQVNDYLINESIYLGGGIEVRADVRIQATSLFPLAGKQAIGGRRWTIFGHPQLALDSVAAPANREPKRCYTTGAITRPCYSQTDVGAKAAFHHTTAALLVEVSGNRCWVRQLHADSKGAIYDLEHKYTASGWTSGHRVTAITLGDEHVKFMSPSVKSATFTARDSMLNVLRPRHLVRHDVLDGYAGSHHHLKDFRIAARKYWHGDCDYRAELDQAVAHLNKTTPQGCTSVIVPSNHHDHLQQWVQRADDRIDPQNAELICELRRAQHQAARNGEMADAFELYVKPRLKCQAVFLDRNQPFLLHDVDHSQHGDVGINGSRWSDRAAARTTYKISKGHSHVESIEKSVYSAGQSCGHLEYQKGLGSHTNAHIVLYPNGKRCIVAIRGRRWRGKN